MPYPECFYRDSKQATSSEYSPSPPGVMNVNLLTQGKPCFKQTFAVKSKASTNDNLKKTLIIMDHHANEWSEQEPKIINRLWVDGFTIYLWQDGYFILYTPGVLSLPNIPDRISEIENHEKVLRAFCHDFQIINEKQCMIVDDYWLSVVANQGEMPARRIVSIKSSRLDQLEHLLSATPPVDGVEYSQFEAKMLLGLDLNILDRDFKEKYQKQLKIQEEVVRAMQMNNNHEIAPSINCKLIISSGPFLNLLSRNSHLFHFDWYHSIELQFEKLFSKDPIRDNTANWQNIAKKIGHIFPDLANRDCAGFIKVLFVQDKQKACFIMQELECTPTSKPSEYPDSLKNLSVMTTEKEFKSIKLKNLFLIGITVTISEIIQILENSPNLETLRLEGCEIVAGSSFPDYRCEHLQELIINECKIHDPRLSKFIQAMVNLRMLTLTSYIFQGIEFFNFPSLPNLTSLTLQITSQINLRQCASKLPVLERLELRGGAILSLDDLDIFFRLQSLTFRDCAIESKSAGENHQTCKELVIQSCSTDPNTIYNLLATFANIMTLRIESLQMPDILGSGTIPKLLELTNLEISNGNHGKLVINILKKAANLKKLKIIFDEFGGYAGLYEARHLNLLTLDVQNIKNDKYTLLKKLLIDKKELIFERIKHLETKSQEFNNDRPETHNFPESEKADTVTRGQNSRSNVEKPKPKEVNNGRPQTQNFPDSEKCDADTRDQNTQFNVQKIFYAIDGSPDPDPRMYRLKVYNEVIVNSEPCNPDNAFILNKKGDLNLVPSNAIQVDSHTKSLTKNLKNTSDITYNYGEQALHVDHTWRPIASLAREDTILQYHNESNIKLSIQYSMRDGLHYIRTDGVSAEIILDFVLKRPNISTKVPAEFQAQIERYNKFHSGTLKIDKAYPNGFDYLAAMEKQQLGACRHRSIAYEQNHQKQGRHEEIAVIESESHQFVEVKVDGYWQKFDLGGYPSTMNVHVAKDHFKETSSPQLKADEKGTVLDPKNNRYIAALSTWVKPSVTTPTTLEFCQKQLNGPSKQQLIECSSPDHLIAIEIALEQHCKNTGKKIFYIHSPNELVCSSPTVERVDEQGILRENPNGGGELHDFLQTYPDGILLINYANFPASAIVQFNALLEKNDRTADGTKVNPRTIILGLYDTSKPNRYQGADFYSRVERERAPNRPDLYLDKHIAYNKNSSEKQPILIHLYHDDDWETILLGRWMFNGNQLTYKPGKLQEAFSKGETHLQIDNGLWNDPHFKLFWRQAMLRGEFKAAGMPVKIQSDLHISTSEGYQWHELSKNISIDDALDPQAVTVNPALLSSLFYRYRCDADNSALTSLPGFLEAYQNKSLHLNITHELSEDHWGRLLTEAKAHQVKLLIHAAHTLKLPEFISSVKKKTDQSAVSLAKHTQLHCSTDPDVTKKSIIKNEKNWIDINVSDLTPNDLFTTILGHLQTKPLKFIFHNDAQILSEALNQNKKIILTGTFSEELQQALAALLIERASGHASGQLILLSEKLNALQMFPVTHHSVTAADKRSHLKFNDNMPDSLLIEPLAKLQARERHMQLHGKTANTTDAWRGLLSIPKPAPMPVNPDLNRSKELAEQFDKQRLEEITAVLKISPFVYIAGYTAVGKTTFINTMMNKTPYQLYHGEAEILNYVNDKNPDTDKILFIDEENISKRGWSFFEGLMNDPPTLLIDGKLHTLTDKHKVVFAGNPANYGGGRKISSLFERHGNVVLFERLPQEYIYERMIKPIFSGLSDAPMQKMAEHWLKLYRFLDACSKNEILISPREIQMMAILSAAYLKKMPTADPLEVARYYAFFVAKQLVPKDNLSDFNLQFAPKQELPPLIIPQSHTLSGLLVTPSRKNMIRQVNDLIHVHEFRKNPENNSAQKYGGLGGFILEGAPGIGKSVAVIAILRAQGYSEIRLGDAPLPKGHTEKRFYRLHASMLFETKKELLIRAFNEGVFVIADELNSASIPELERLLNDLLMGKYRGNNPVNPGFTLIATQNPFGEGRTQATNALARRCLSTQVDDYPPDEMCDILQHEGIPHQHAREMVEAFTFCCNRARNEKLHPAPNFRDLLKLVPPKDATITPVAAVAPVTPVEPAAPKLPAKVTINSKESLHTWLQTYPTAQQASDVFKMPIDTLIEKFKDLYTQDFKRPIVPGFFRDDFLHVLKDKPSDQVWKLICDHALKKATNRTNSTLLKMVQNIDLVIQQQVPRR